MDYASDSSVGRTAYHSAIAFAWQLVLLTAGLMIFAAAAVLLNVAVVYLQGDGLMPRIVSDTFWIASVGLECVGIIWFLVTLGLRSWRFFVEIRAMWSHETL